MTGSKELTQSMFPGVALPGCGACWKCLDGVRVPFLGGEFMIPVTSQMMILCVECGNKRCPKASDCSLKCTNSNAPGQAGSVYE